MYKAIYNIGLLASTVKAGSTQTQLSWKVTFAGYCTSGAKSEVDSDGVFDHAYAEPYKRVKG